MSTGTLYIVSTPIGNLEDITLRALRILNEADMVAAEDTRRTGILLKHYNIKKPLTSYFEHNERSKTPVLVEQMLAGQTVALVSEAGTPTISDPGFRLVTAALAKGVPVVPIPGVSAAVTALSVSGLPVHRFAFEGFLPPKSGRRKNLLKKLAADDRTLIFYESPHRVVSALKDLIEVFGDRPAALAREVTKLHEEVIRGSLSEILATLENRTVKGEITLVVRGRPINHPPAKPEGFKMPPGGGRPNKNR